MTSMLNENMESIARLLSVHEQAKLDERNLKDFAEYLRTNLPQIRNYEGVCDDLKTMFNDYDSTKPFDFTATISQLELLSSLAKKLQKLLEMLKRCESLPEGHNKGDVVRQGRNVFEECLKKMRLEDVEDALRIVDAAIEKVHKLENSFHDDELIRLEALRTKLQGVKDTLEAERTSMWQEDYQKISSRIKSYAEKPSLSDSLIQELRDLVSEAVRKRSDYILLVENDHGSLRNNQHISGEYSVVRSEARTVNEYDRRVKELLDRLSDIRRENWGKAFKVVGKVLLYTFGLVFIIIGSFFKLIFDRDDD